MAQVGVGMLICNTVFIVLLLFGWCTRKREEWICRHSRQCREYFVELVNEGYPIPDALVKVCEVDLPELSPQTHRKITTKFKDLDLLLRFLNLAREMAATKTGLLEEEILALLETTTFDNGRPLDTRTYPGKNMTSNR